MEERRVATMRISSELLASALRLPEGTVITGVRDDIDYLGCISVRIESPSLPPVAVGCAVPMVSPEFRMSPKRINDTEFAGWGQ